MTMQEPEETNDDMRHQSQASVNMQSLAESVLEELVDHISRGLCHQTHRAAKLGYLSLEESAAQEEKKYLIVDRQGQDVFGESSSTSAKKAYECVCPHCDRTLVAQRFAPHLEKCMGMGRNSSRIASKRIANTGKAGADSDLEDCDKSSDNDWNEKPVLKKSRKKRDRPTITNGLLRKVAHRKTEGSGSVLLRNASGQFTSASSLANGTASASAASAEKKDIRIEAQEFQF